MLTQYLTRTKQLLMNPGAPVQLYADSDLTGWINEARGQVAGESESIRALGTISTVAGQRNYNIANINCGNATTTGIADAIHVRAVLFAIATGQQWIRPRPWPWFMLFKLNNPVPGQSRTLEVWSQFGQGVSGSFYVDPIPDSVFTLTCDCVCYPIPLVDDTTVEAIPYLWTDAVPYFAAYLALLSAQAASRQADANRMFERYTEFMARARQFANPSVNRYLYEQSMDPAQINKFGPPPQRGGGPGGAA